MLKKIGLSTVALLAAMTCVQPAPVFAEDRDDYRARYSDSRGDRDNHEFRDRDRRDRDDRDRRDSDRRDRRDRDDRDRDRDRNWRRDDDARYRDNFFRR